MKKSSAGKEKLREKETGKSRISEKKERKQKQKKNSTASPPAASGTASVMTRTDPDAEEEEICLQKKEMKNDKTEGPAEEEIAAGPHPDLNDMHMEVPEEQRWKKWILPGAALIASICGLTVLILIQPPQEPSLELKSSEIRLSAGMEFQPSRYVSGECPEGYELICPEPFTAEKPEVRLVMYELKGNDVSVKKILRVNIVDEKAPVITLSQNHAELLTATKFACRSYLKSAVDDVDGDLTGSVDCSDTLKDTESQKVLYSVKDRAGNRAEAELSVHFADYGLHGNMEEEESEDSEILETEAKKAEEKPGSVMLAAAAPQSSWHASPSGEPAMKEYEEYEEISWTETVQESVPVTYGETFVDHSF